MRFCTFLLLVSLSIDGILCQNGWYKGYQKAEDIARIENRIKRDRILTYAIQESSGSAEGLLPMSLVMASLAEIISHTTCLQFVEAEEGNGTSGMPVSPTADIIIRGNVGFSQCYIEFRGIDYSTNQNTCTKPVEWLVDRLLMDYLGMNPVFRYPLYKAKGETRLWFMEISNLNQVFECPCKDEAEKCDLEKSCDTNGRLIGKCRATCGLCPYYDYPS